VRAPTVTALSPPVSALGALCTDAMVLLRGQMDPREGEAEQTATGGAAIIFGAHFRAQPMVHPPLQQAERASAVVAVAADAEATAAAASEWLRLEQQFPALTRRVHASSAAPPPASAVPLPSSLLCAPAVHEGSSSPHQVASFQLSGATSASLRTRMQPLAPPVAPAGSAGGGSENTARAQKLLRGWDAAAKAAGAQVEALRVAHDAIVSGRGEASEPTGAHGHAGEEGAAGEGAGAAGPGGGGGCGQVDGGAALDGETRGRDGCGWSDGRRKVCNDTTETAAVADGEAGGVEERRRGRAEARMPLAALQVSWPESGSSELPEVGAASEHATYRPPHTHPPITCGGFCGGLQGGKWGDVSAVSVERARSASLSTAPSSGGGSEGGSDVDDEEIAAWHLRMRQLVGWTDCKPTVMTQPEGGSLSAAEIRFGFWFCQQDPNCVVPGAGELRDTPG
jgi:hypothetical protein